MKLFSEALQSYVTERIDPMFCALEKYSEDDTRLAERKNAIYEELNNRDRHALKPQPYHLDMMNEYFELEIEEQIETRAAIYMAGLLDCVSFLKVIGRLQ